MTMSSAIIPVFENQVLRIAQALNVLSLRSKASFGRFVIFGITFVLGGLMILSFGAIVFMGLQEHYLAHKLGSHDLVFIVFLGGIFLAAWVLREACWEYLPKKFDVDLITNCCVLVTYGIFRWRFMTRDIDFIGLRVGRLAGGAKGPDAYYSRLYIFKKTGIGKLRLCSATCYSRSYHEAFQEGVTVSRIVAQAVKVPLRYHKKKWVDLALR